MNQRELLHVLGQRLDADAARITRLDQYAEGKQPLSYLAPDARVALGGRLGQVSVNIPRLLVSSISERLRVAGFTRDGEPDPASWTTWTANDLDQLSAVAHREALTLGRSFALVWAGPKGAQISIESALQMAVVRDPATRQVTAALKRWEVDEGRGQRAVLYEPGRITKWSTDAPYAPAASGAWTVTETLNNPLNAVPCVPLVNAERLLDVDGRSEFADVIPLVDALTKLLSDLMVSSEFFARPRRWATGLEIPEDDDGNLIQPFSSEADRVWISEDHETKFGAFPASDLGGYTNGVNVIMQQIVAVTGLPEHVLGVGSDNPTSADAIRASEAGLTARAEAKQRAFGPAWEQVMRLAHAVDTGTDPATVDIGVQWADPSTRSVAQEADAVTKLYAAGLLPASVALERLGYSAADIARIRTSRRADVLDQVIAGVTAS